MKEYPESFKAMDLVAEHRLRVLYASDAWQSRHVPLPSPIAAEVTSMLGQLFEVVLPPPCKCMDANILTGACWPYCKYQGRWKLWCGKRGGWGGGTPLADYHDTSPWLLPPQSYILLSMN
jgi:hypothetical protein